MNTMTTYSGRKFDPMQMTPGDVYIEDIAHALSLLCRGGGQLTYFYSVGQHSLNCATEAKAGDIVAQHQIQLCLDQLSCLYLLKTRCTGKYLLCHCHSHCLLLLFLFIQLVRSAQLFHTSDP